MFATPEFMVFISFALFVGLIFYLAVPHKVIKALDQRSAQIKTELDDARALREEAQSILADYQRRAREAEKEAENIISQAQKEADIYAKETRLQLEEALARRTKAADLKISQAEAQAVDEVRSAAVEAAIDASRKIIGQKLAAAGGNDLIDQSIKEIKSRLN